MWTNITEYGIVKTTEIRYIMFTKTEKNGGGSHGISHLVAIMQAEYMFLICFRDTEFASDVKNICK